MPWFDFTAKVCGHRVWIIARTRPVRTILLCPDCIGRRNSHKHSTADARVSVWREKLFKEARHEQHPQLPV